ncbi:hypothetical protein FHS90_004438 [Rufibacter quisquiliarum]|uniref:Uncharacterized protein n=1 Tax=Rufibacter quisquiliarum TaxID=1549639 RepID=A0A839GZ32_9BACT|nr:hypothetical protein [Rufibacter quisquiliarum]
MPDHPLFGAYSCVLPITVLFRICNPEAGTEGICNPRGGTFDLQAPRIANPQVTGPGWQIPDSRGIRIRQMYGHPPLAPRIPDTPLLGGAVVGFTRGKLFPQLKPNHMFDSEPKTQDCYRPPSARKTCGPLRQFPFLACLSQNNSQALLPQITTGGLLYCHHSDSF